MLRILRLSCVRWSLAVMMGGMMSMAEAKEAEELAWAGIFPGQIKTVALVAPACPANSSEALDRAIARLKQAGIRVKLMPHAREGEPATRYETIAVEKRVADLEQAWLDPEVDLVWCIRGGTGTPDVVEMQPENEGVDGTMTFVCTYTPSRSGIHVYGVRVMPCTEGLSSPLETRLVLWG